MSSSLFISYLVIQSYIMRPIDSAVKQTINIVNTGSYQRVYSLYQLTVIVATSPVCLYHVSTTSLPVSIATSPVCLYWIIASHKSQSSGSNLNSGPPKYSAILTTWL
jgi:hypothetical protein